MSVPERYQRFVHPEPQPVHPAAVELHAEHDPIVYVPDAYGQMVPMRKSQAPAPVQPAPVRDLAPQPLLDPIAQRMIGGGVLGAGVGWGAAQLLSALAGAGTGLLAFALLLLAARMGGARSVTNIRVEQRASWFSSNRTGFL
ncbi:hypothetical protein [Streptomyces sp. LN704]|uniref:hypothetical protein n=1 Tax=Streptomyces sp. LN704 TaxID=3112982 RepID=UPI003715C429